MKAVGIVVGSALTIAGVAIVAASLNKNDMDYLFGCDDCGDDEISEAGAGHGGITEKQKEALEAL